MHSSKCSFVSCLLLFLHLTDAFSLGIVWKILSHLNIKTTTGYVTSQLQAKIKKLEYSVYNQNKLVSQKQARWPQLYLMCSAGKFKLLKNQDFLLYRDAIGDFVSAFAFNIHLPHIDFFFPSKLIFWLSNCKEETLSDWLWGSSLTVHAFDALAIMLYKSNVISPGSCTNTENSIKDAAFPQYWSFSLKTTPLFQNTLE